MKCQSLFSGIGGFDLGLERAGIETIEQVEVDQSCRNVLARHFPNAERKEDVREVQGIPGIDLVPGGFPCQDLSVAGRRAGLAGDRSGLFYEFMRVVDEGSPRWVLIENVPGLLSSNDGKDMGIVLGTLGELGYGWAYRVLNAEYFGVAQRRRRVFIVGCLGDAGRAAEVLFEPESCGGNPAPRRSTRESVTTSLTGSTGGPDDNDAQGGHLVAYGINSDTYSRSGESVTPSPDANGKLRLRPPGLGIHEEVSPTLQTVLPHAVAMRWREGKPGGGKGALLSDDRSLTLATANDQTVFISENQRAEVLETDYARQLTTGGGKPGQGYPAIRDGMLVRRLTPTECERLQGFPDGWTAGQKDAVRYRQLGNAVCVPVAEWIGRRLMEMATS